jgi:hypothetical protein
MNTNRYSLAAWASVASVLVFVPEIIFTFIYDAGFSAGAQGLGPVAALLLIKTALSAYALYRLRDYLNERFEFHQVDTLVMLMIIGGILFSLVATAARAWSGEMATWASMGMLLGVGLPLGAITMLFGYRIRRVNGRLGGFKNAFAYMNMGAPLCFLTVVLAPLGLVLMAASQVLLALIFFNSEEEGLEFV